MKNDYRELERLYKPNYLKKISGHPLFGYIVLIVILAAIQLLFMFTEGIISLSVSRAICMTMVYTIAAMGLGVLLGLAGLVSLGTSAFIGVGAYAAGNIMKAAQMPFVFVLVAVTVIAIILGLLVGFISLRVRGLHLMIITLALAQILNELFRTPNSITGGANGLTGVPFPKIAMLLQLNRETTYFVVLAVMFVLIILTLNLINSPTGRALMAMSSSESLAQAMGIRLLKYRVLAFVLATVYAMIAGALYISSTGAATYTTWTILLSLNALAAVILGGNAKPSSTLMGGFVVFCLDLAILKSIPFFIKYTTASVIFSGVLIVLIVVKYPGGLARLLQNIKNGTQKLAAKWRMYKYGPEN